MGPSINSICAELHTCLAILARKTTAQMRGLMLSGTLGGASFASTQKGS